MDPTAFTTTQTDIVEAYRRDYDVPGVAVAIVRDNRIIAEGGFGKANLDSGAAPTAHTAWPIASVTKSFTCVAAMQCVERSLHRFLVGIVRAGPWQLNGVQR